MRPAVTAWLASCPELPFVAPADGAAADGVGVVRTPANGGGWSLVWAKGADTNTHHCVDYAEAVQRAADMGADMRKAEPLDVDDALTEAQAWRRDRRRAIAEHDDANASYPAEVRGQMSDTADTLDFATRAGSIPPRWRKAGDTPIAWKAKKRTRRVKRHREFAGLPVYIESDVGEERHWKDEAGRDGVTVMRLPYGYIKGTNGADGDEVDCYLGPDEDAPHAFIVHQMAKPDFTEYDEDKVFLGLPDLAAAVAAYAQHRDDGTAAIGGVSVVSMGELIEFVDRPALQKTDDNATRRAGVIAVDFDKTLFSDGVFPDVGEPLPGARDALAALCDAGYRILIWSARSTSALAREKMRAALDAHGFPYDAIDDGSTPGKPRVDLFIDDRAIGFRGDWQDVLAQVFDRAAMAKAGHALYIGPRGGKYGNPEHTTPYNPGGPGQPSAPAQQDEERRGSVENLSPDRADGESHQAYAKRMLEHVPGGWPITKPIPKDARSLTLNTSGDVHSRAVATWDNSAGHTQYAYTQEWQRRSDEKKWSKLRPMIEARSPDKAQEHVEAILKDEHAPRAQQDTALALALILHTGLRPGNEANQKKYGSTGITTLRREDISVHEDGTVRLHFVGKAGHDNKATISDPVVSEHVRRVLAEPVTPSGQLLATDDGKIREMLRGMDTGAAVRPKDIRTYRATMWAIDAIGSRQVPTLPDGTIDKKAARKIVLDVADHVSGKLNNTRSMALTKYIHPVVWEQWLGAHGTDATQRLTPEAVKLVKADRSLKDKIAARGARPIPPGDYEDQNDADEAEAGSLPGALNGILSDDDLSAPSSPMTKALPPSLAVLSDDAREAMCINCGLCCMSYAPDKTIVPAVPCRFLRWEEADDGTAESRCAVYNERHEIAKEWCRPLPVAIAAGVLPSACPYVADLAGYVGTEAPLTVDADGPLRALVKAHPSAPPPWADDATWRRALDAIAK